MARILHKPTEKGREVIAFLDSKVGENILHADYSKVMAKVVALDAEEKVAILTVCVSTLTGPESIKSGATNIAAVRVIVALLPLSLGVVADLLDKFQDKHNYEVHFTLFCYLDWAQEMPDASSLAKEVLVIMENYLFTVPRETARAVWMAGDMLGGHWNEQEAIPLLIRTSQGAKYSVGRMGGLVGLKEVLDRLPMESDTHKDILKTVRKISLSDPSKYVREDANTLFQHWQRQKRVDVVPSDDVEQPPRM